MQQPSEQHFLHDFVEALAEVTQASMTCCAVGLAWQPQTPFGQQKHPTSQQSQQLAVFRVSALVALQGIETEPGQAAQHPPVQAQSEQQQSPKSQQKQPTSQQSQQLAVFRVSALVALQGIETEPGQAAQHPPVQAQSEQQQSPKSQQKQPGAQAAQQDVVDCGALLLVVKVAAPINPTDANKPTNKFTFMIQLLKNQQCV